MTRKDFELIAKVIKELPPVDIYDVSGHKVVALIFANALATTNPLFNREKFLKACGVVT